MLASIKDRVSSEHEHVRIVKFEYRALRAPQNMIRASGYLSMLGARPTPTIYIPDVLLEELEVGLALLYPALDVLALQQEIHRSLGLIVKLEVPMKTNTYYTFINCIHLISLQT